MGQLLTDIDLNLILANAPGNKLIWNRFLSELTHQLDSESGSLLVTDLQKRQNTHFLFSANIPIAYKEQYENGLNRQDSFNYFISKKPKHIYFDQSPNNSGSSPVNHFKLPSKQKYRMGVSIPCNKNHALSLFISRKHEYSAQEQQQFSHLLQSLIPSLEQAIYSEQRNKINSQLLHYMDDHFDGYIIIDRHLNLLFSDPVYTTIINQLDCVTISNNRLYMHPPAIEEQLLAIIADKNKPKPFHNQDNSCRISLIPISSMDNLYKWECYQDGFILTFTHDKEKNPSLNRLTDIYHLSRCEALCALHFMKTPSIPDVASITYRSTETVRNHIKHTMQKMDVHNQAELMKKLITLSAL